MMISFCETMQCELENKDRKAAHLQSLFRKYKTLASQNLSLTRFSWLQKVSNISFIVKFSCPNFPSSLGCEVIGDEQALFILRSIQSDFQQEIRDCETFEDVLNRLSELVRRAEVEAEEGGERSLETVETVKAAGTVLEELLCLGWEKVHSVSANLRVVTIRSRRERSQELVVTFPPDYPNSPLTLEHGLPACWSPPSSSLSALHSSWEAALQDYRAAWRELEELDRLCWVLDPANSNQLARRLAVNSAVSLHVELDASNPSGIPTLRFLGSTEATENLRTCWAENIDLWDDDDPVLTNLERVLDLEFPRSDIEDGQSQPSVVECGICLEESVEGQLPCQGCEDEKCDGRYHPTCLYQWLLRAPTPTRRAFSGLLTGRCPNCQKPIMCSKPAE